MAATRASGRHRRRASPPQGDLAIGGAFGLFSGSVIGRSILRVTAPALMVKIDDVGAPLLRRAGQLLNIDDSDTCRSRFPLPVVVTTRVRVLVVLSPALLADLAARRLAPLDVLVVIAAEGTPVPEGHYDVVVRNVSLPAGVTGDLVVELPAPPGTAPFGTTAGELMAVDRLDDVADLLASRWPPAGV